MTTEYKQELDDDGNKIIMRYDNGQAVEWYPDPGWYGAQAETTMRRVGNYKRSIHGLFSGAEGDAEIAQDWARLEPYYDAVRAIYPNASGAGETIGSFANPVNWAGGGAKWYGQMLMNTASALTDEALNYDPFKTAEDYVATTVNALLGDTLGRGLNRVMFGAENFLQRASARGFRTAMRQSVPEGVQRLFDRGYKLTDPSKYFDEGDPLKPIVEQAFKSNQSSGLPSNVARENAEFNQSKLRGRVRAALGLEPKEGVFNENDMLQAEKLLQAKYEQLAKELPDGIEIPDAFARQLADTDGYQASARTGGQTYSDVRRYLGELEAYQQQMARYQADPSAPRPVAPEPPKLKRGEFFSARSDVTRSAKNTESQAYLTEIGNSLDALDRYVAAQVPDNDNWLSNYNTAREQWQVYFLMQNKGNLGKEGTISIPRLAASMAREGSFGPRAMYDDAGQFTNAATYDLAQDLVALNDPAVFGNSQTTDRASMINFISSALSDRSYAGGTLANAALVNRAFASGGGRMGVNDFLTGMMGDFSMSPNTAGAAAGAAQGPVGPLKGNIMARTGSMLASRPENAPNILTDTLIPFLAPGLMPTAEVRDQALGPFIGSTNDIPQGD